MATGPQKPRLIDNVYLFWALLALPGLWLVVQRYVLHAKVDFVPIAGEIASWMLIATLLITPLMMLFGPLPWLKPRRRYLGVASFLYTLLHIGPWMIDASLRELARSFIRPEIATGWIAGGLMLALALTSTDAAVRRMGTGWKRLQRWVYPAAALTLVHWLTTTEDLTIAILSSVPLVALSIWRLLRHRARMGAA